MQTRLGLKLAIVEETIARAEQRAVRLEGIRALLVDMNRNCDAYDEAIGWNREILSAAREKVRRLRREIGIEIPAPP